jgi:hypothetical protein
MKHCQLKKSLDPTPHGNTGDFSPLARAVLEHEWYSTPGSIPPPQKKERFWTDCPFKEIREIPRCDYWFRAGGGGV